MYLLFPQNGRFIRTLENVYIRYIRAPRLKQSSALHITV